MGNAQAAPLFDAIAEGDVDAAVKVLETHPGLSHKRAGKKNRTVYHACASSGQIAVLRRLCEHVWHNVPDELGKTHPDNIPEGRSHPIIYQAVNSYDESGLTPLMLACKKGHAGTVQYLLSQGADPWIGDRLLGRSALHHAARANHPECIEAILSSPFVELSGKVRSRECRLVDYPSNAGYTPLHYAAASRSADAAVVLFRHGANPNAKNWEAGFDFIQLDRGSTPLHAAARYQNLDMAMVLLSHWDDVLRRRDVTDPRVVENYERVKPYQVVGVRQNKAISRVLDPSTPIAQITDPFGAGGGQQQQVAANGQPSKVVPLLVYQRRSPTEGQVPNVIKVAGASAAHGASPERVPPPGWEDVLSGKSVAVSSTGDFVTVYRCAEFAADYDALPLPPPGSTKGGGSGQRGGLLRTQSDNRRGTLGLASTSASNPAALARTRSGAAPASSHGMLGRNGSSSSSEDDMMGAAKHRMGQLSAISDSPDGEVARSGGGGVSSSPKSPSSPAPAAGAAKVAPSPFANAGGPVLHPVTPPRGDLAASVGMLKTVRSVGADGAGAAAFAGSNMPSPHGSKPPSPDGAKALTARSITRSLSKKLSGALMGSGGTDAAANPSPARAPTATRGSSPPDGNSGPPQAFSAWGVSSTRTPYTPAVTPGSKAAVWSSCKDKDRQREQAPDFTRDSFAQDAEPVEVTMYPHTRVNLEQLKAGDTCNTVAVEREARRRSSGEQSREHRGSGGLHRHQPQFGGGGGGGSDAGGHCRVSGGSGSSGGASSSCSSRWSAEAKAAKATPVFNLSRQGLLPANELSEDESKLEDRGRVASALSPTGSRPRAGPQIGPF